MDLRGHEHVLLKHLYNGSAPRGRGWLAGTVGNMTTAEAKAVWDETSQEGRAYFDYLKGRPLKVRFEGGKVPDFRLYDRDAGPGAGQYALDRTMDEITAPTETPPVEPKP